MYKAIIRPVLFLFDPEKVHHVVVYLLKLMAKIPGVRSVTAKCMNYRRSELRTVLAGLVFENKVGLAAGFDKNADFYQECAMFGYSFVEIGTVTPLPQPGNPKPRLFRLPADSALINRMGFNSKGVDYAVKRLMKRNNHLIIGGNIGKNTGTPNEKAAEDYLYCFRKLYDVVDYLVINVSCPNIAGLEKLQDHNSLKEILDAIMVERAGKQVFKPVFLKISPDLSWKQIDETLELYHKTGLDGIIAVNTTVQRTGLLTAKEQVSRKGSGGLSGKPLHNRTLEIVSYICKQSNNSVPVIASGGIMTPDDALEMIKAGASLVQVYTGFIYEGPCVVKRMNKVIYQYLLQQS
jgi:dihydroorotate dehydrogenase